MQTPLTLYIHLPWCERKCPYCDFNSHEGTVEELRYIKALEQDMLQSLPHIWGRKIESIFIGGGTPSLFSGEAIETLLNTVRNLFELKASCEVTLEANPGTLQREKLAAYHQAGINRLSIGVQTTHDPLLKNLGRIHNREQALQSIAWAKEFFDNINVDLMFAVPQQTLVQADADIKILLQQDINHISYYQLTIEPNTVFYSQTPRLPNDDDAMMMYQNAQEQLSINGYEQYEVSAYRRDHACVHNLNYWHFGDYVGIGAGAHGKLSGPWGIKRIEKLKHPQKYMQRMLEQDFDNAQKETLLEKNQILLEFLMNALRLKSGFRREVFQGHTGLPWENLLNSVEPAVQAGLLELDRERIFCSNMGYSYLNSVLEDYIEVEEL